MEKFVKSFIGLSLIYFIALVASCSEDASCGGFPTEFDITGFNLTESVADNESNLFDLADALENDTLQFDQLVLNLRASFEALSFTPRESKALIGAAYACTPPPLTPLDTVSSIEIFLLEQESISSFSTTDVVTDNFDVIAFTEEGGFFSRVPLADFNSSNNPASTNYFLFLNSPPDEIIEAGFRIRVNLIDDSSFEASSKILYISP